MQEPRNGNQQNRNLKDHILELNRTCEVINRGILAIGEKLQVGQKEIRVKLIPNKTVIFESNFYGGMGEGAGVNLTPLHLSRKTNLVSI